MFTGIIIAVGSIDNTKSLGAAADAGLRLTIDAGGMPLEDVKLGDSIAINGACMTVVEKDAQRFQVDISRESLLRTCGLDREGPVNLEKALTLNDRIGGHLVSGHVDGVGKVISLDSVGESWRLTIAAPTSLARFIVYKGSIVVNGVSLTINTVDDKNDACHFSINLIPHTMEATTLKHLVAEGPVNLEIDMIARYVERMLSFDKNTAQQYDTRT